jgi:hypothetical protein
MKVVNGNVEFISCEIHAWEHAENMLKDLLLHFWLSRKLGDTAAC